MRLPVIRLLFARTHDLVRAFVSGRKEAHVKGFDHLLLGVVVELGGFVGALQQGDQCMGRRAVPDGRRYYLRHEAVVVPQMHQLQQ